MNLSFSSDVSADASDDRPDATEEALLHRRRIGYLEGSPLVEPNDFDGVRLGEPLGDPYDHYRRGGDLYLPDAGDFLHRLFEQPEIGSIEDAADELYPPHTGDKRALRKAADLHGVDLDDVGAEEDPEPEHDVVTLPSGESIDVDGLREPVYTDSRLLHALLGSYGFSTEEAALFLSEQLGENVNERDIRQAAESVRLF